MNRAEISERLRQFIAKQFPLSQKQELTLDEPLLKSGIIDSMGTLELVTFMESDFQIVLSDEEMLSGNFETLGKMTDFVASKLESTQPIA